MGEQSLLLTLDSCTILVKNGDVRSKRSRTRESPPTKAMVRLTVSLPKTVLARVNIIAGQMEVSAGWVIRKAVIEFVNRDIPLFRSDEKF
jgi:Ribbon-helix-helix protein, copG family